MDNNNFETKKNEFDAQQNNMNNPYYNTQSNDMNNQYNAQQNGYMNNQYNAQQNGYMNNQYNAQQNGYMNNQYYNPQQNYSMNSQKDNGKTSMICGILSIVVNFIAWFCCIGYAGVPLSIVAIVFGVQTKEINGGKITGDGKIGIITGIIGLCVLALGFLVGIFIGIASVM